jgi:hypothetical protein
VAFFTRAAAATPTNDLPAPHGRTMMPAAASNTLQLKQDTAFLQSQYIEASAQRSAVQCCPAPPSDETLCGTAIDCCTHDAAISMSDFWHETMLLAPENQAPAATSALPERARPLPNILLRLFSW